ncbi:protein of unknown function [Tistlia consotensis]|uniref:DUF4399 domain-containing protein n=1 Tax=Tistlia consotensis USBA 355 TaxID=560819 RepID=A0A1Y6B9P4_9PROT|nr:DUF4399 domain-containing protein [Tistlia consotensis]SME98282.1 protein of unknown function [Tistlia consotensis USBA 355]SNR57594.1 protein of unknown function [Tistlia consotensis]
MTRRLALTLSGALFGALLTLPAAAADRTKAPEGARVYIISPADGAVVSSPVTVLFGAEGIGVAPAGVDKPKTGHHHLIIDADVPPLDEPIPSDAHHRHFGGGQTQATIDLPPGKHRLFLMMGDMNHMPFDPPVMSQPITITVK